MMMRTLMPKTAELAPGRRVFYTSALALLNQSGIPYLVGGAYALHHFAHIHRDTKDLDVFVRPGDCRRVLDHFEKAGHEAELTFSHWLGKVFGGEDLIDIVFNSGNGLCPVDDAWFDYAVPGRLFGLPVRYCPPEEMIWQKAFIMERKRFDGADVLHLLRARADDLDWSRLLNRFANHWRVLLSHLILFGFVYPDESDKIPVSILRLLLARVKAEHTPRRGERLGERLGEPLCRGPLLSLLEYLTDVEDWGYQDGRLRPHGNMSPDEVADWTAAFINP